jgi:hypothetical protein
MQPTDTHPTLTLVLEIWAGIGPLVGLLVGHRLVRSWQREQWLLDSRKDEFRELISSLSTASVKLMTHIGSEGDAESLQRATDALETATRICVDRIYIANDVEELKIGQRFLQVYWAMQAGNDLDSCHERLSNLIKEIAERARKG